MTAVTIDLPEILVLMDELLLERGPDFEYLPPASFGGQCAYFETVRDTTGEHYPDPWEADASKFVPSCGVGALLHKLGVTGADLYNPETQQEWNTYTGAWSVINDVVTPLKDIHFTNPAITFLESFQENQDEGRNWGDCYERAKYQVGLSNTYEGSDEWADERADEIL